MDDSPVARRTVRAFLEWRNFRVCGEAANGEEAILKVRQLKPNIVLLDVNMLGMNGIQTAAVILAKAPKTKIVFLSVHNTPGTLHATRMWAYGFVPKSAIATALIPALNHAAGITAKAL